ncbi:hypothetical protein LTR10_021259 [Elasticomyces elasticus]|uniref:54S ribosomal protein L31, mitochondrial n=1 Tax=Exophiala sideris TaxID=1016849 RepID=A0ABR0JFE1_9EURO|nr:hypothetical protein LTR10_021259 [Elasticomyces elasticus]KAK5025372.1 hypothetical protein LTS07_008223 [Exophiala sideris]KAK5032947.1 hypothetical protein LTR13_006912 [Exophiala sideris]KAK5063432.1 hypothetical protein LTR69_004138 [Exophiala sideris]
MFRPTAPLSGGLLWKIPWRLSAPQKARQRKRLRLVDKVVDTVSTALHNNGGITAKAVERWYQEMPREEEMLPKDKYTIFDRKEKKYRKGIHSMLCEASEAGIVLISISRASQVDKSEPESEPTRILVAAIM